MKRSPERLDCIYRKDATVLPNLTPDEARIIGCLMEKSVLTPDQYPLTLNALTNACNQKSSRNPVMALDKMVVQRTARELGNRWLVRVEENFKSGVEKYKQTFCSTPLGDLKFDRAQFAVICLLLLRGAQTPGEIKARSGRLHVFAENSEVEATLQSMIDWQSQPLVVKLPRTPGRRDAEYMHLFSGPVDVEAHVAQAQADTARSSFAREGSADLAKRVSRLEEEVKQLRDELQTLREGR